MSEYGFWSLVPSILAIFLALRTKQVFLSLTLGIWVGWVILNGGNPLTGTMDTLAAFVEVFKDGGNTRTVIFTLLVGSLIALIQRSGGVAGFIQWVSIRLEKKANDTKSRKMIQLYAALTGMIIFVESNISILTVGTLYRPIFDKMKIPREKLAYLADSSSAPSCIIFPFNAWGAFIMSLLLAQGFDSPFKLLFSSLAYNFYPFLAIAIVLYVILSGKDFGPMKKAEERTRTTGRVIAEGSTPMISDEIALIEAKHKNKLRAYNMTIPILVMILFMPTMLVYTGWQDGMTGSWIEQVFTAIGNGSGSTAVMYSITASIVSAMLLYKSQKIMGLKEMIDLAIKGMSGMVSLALLMVFAFTIGALCKELGTGLYVAHITEAWLSPKLVPAIVFATSCFIAFSTGTSWGTFAIMISIAVPMAQNMDSNVSMAIAAAIGGGVFGDHCSPISDTTIISSMASASDHIDHVNTQLPYAAIAGIATFALYLAMAWIM
ncbi:Na+/H+ antiporter NhaC family protein [Reichenbachiella agariperforans]|uniref:Na+/H+ antiporter NhaC family protein n=1 Tax=Reichenbachiella agariperforans TaxID=156994 RepID=UPI001C083D37|nr:Na+/H+ antiporter NhaC family protein [Reichenbachiella agariperforans]MBU2916319.1 sodium:solute symporter [Reichenbachiella agariperforans]